MSAAPQLAICRACIGPLVIDAGNLRPRKPRNAELKQIPIEHIMQWFQLAGRMQELKRKRQ